MKILFLGNTSIHVLRWIDFFVTNHHEVVLVSLEKMPKNYNYSKFTVIKLNSIFFLRRFKRLSVLSNLFKCRSIIHRIKPDIIHAHSFMGYGLLIPFINYTPTIISAWGTDILFSPNNSRIIYILTKLAIRKATRLHTDGRKTFEVLQCLGSPKDKIIKVYFGTDTNQFSPEKRDKQIWNKYNIKDSIIVISTRQHYPIYDIQTLLYSANRVISQVPSVKFIIASSGPETEQLKVLSQALGLEKSIIFTGYISVDELPIYLASSDIYVSTSLSDAGLAASTAEAMSCGLPVIITDDIDNRDWVTNEVNGFVFSPKNTEELASRIIFMARNETIRQNCGNKNRSLIKLHNNYYLEMKKIECEYIKMKNQLY